MATLSFLRWPPDKLLAMPSIFSRKPAAGQRQMLRTESQIVSPRIDDLQLSWEGSCNSFPSIFWRAVS